MISLISYPEHPSLAFVLIRATTSQVSDWFAFRAPLLKGTSTSSFPCFALRPTTPPLPSSSIAYSNLHIFLVLLWVLFAPPCLPSVKAHDDGHEDAFLPWP